MTEMTAKDAAKGVFTTAATADIAATAATAAAAAKTAEIIRVAADLMKKANRNGEWTAAQIDALLLPVANRRVTAKTAKTAKTASGGGGGGGERRSVSDGKKDVKNDQNSPTEEEEDDDDDDDGGDSEYLPIGSNMENYDKKALGPKRMLFSFYLRDIQGIDIIGETWTPFIDFSFDYLDDGSLKKDENAPYWQMGHSFRKYKEGSEFENFDVCANIINSTDQSPPLANSTSVVGLNGRVLVSAYYSFCSTLRSSSDLRQFPFDTQQLKIVIASDGWFLSDCLFIPENGCNPQLLLENCIDPAVHENSEYFITGIDVELTGHRYENLTRFDNQNESYPEVILTFSMTRNPLYYLRVIVVIICMVLSVAGLSFIDEASDLGTRLSLSTTMFLTLVAFHFVVIGSLPKISYSTRMDQFIGFSYFLMLFMNCQNIVMSRLSSDAPNFCASYCLTIDMVCLAFYYSSIALNVLWFSLPLFTMPKYRDFRKKSNRKFDKIDKNESRSGKRKTE